MALFSMFPEGNQPLPNDEMWRLLQKIAASLYNLTQAGAPPQSNDTEYNLMQRIASYVNSGAGVIASNYRINGGNIQVYNATTQLWYPLEITGTAGNEQLTFGPGVP